MVERWQVADYDDLIPSDDAETEPGGLSAMELQALAQSSRDTVVVLDASGVVIRTWNGSGGGLGLSPGQPLTLHLPQDDATAVQRALQHCLSHGQPEPVSFSSRLPAASGAQAFSAILRKMRNGEVMCIAQDVTAQQAADSALARHLAVERLLRSFSGQFINIAPDGIDRAIDHALSELGDYCDVDRVYLYQLAEHEQYLVHTHGWYRRSRDGRLPFGKRIAVSRLPWLHRRLYNRSLIQVANLDMLPSEAHGEHAMLQQRGVTGLIIAPIVYSGRLHAFLGLDAGQTEAHWNQEQIHLVTAAAEIFASALQRKQSERRIFRLAYYDRLTGLPNRMLLRQRLKQFMHERGDHGFALAVLDLDDASNINDLLGHDVGDLLLKSLSGRLEAFAPAGHPLARWGGDEFVLTLPDADSDTAALVRQVQQLREVLGEPVRIAGHELRVSSSVGIARYPGHASSVDELFRYAEMALRQAKQQGREGLAIYENHLERRATYRSQVETRMRLALEQGAFELHYQPLVRTQDTNRIAGAEALLRWHDKELGTIPPDEFIDVAEETGLIVPLGDWVLEQACRDLAAWRAEGLHIPRVSVNVSGHQLLDDRLPRTLAQALKRHGLPPTAIELEITETTLMEREKGSLPLLQQLRDLGVGIAVDDFGTGYSSLSKIKHLPVTVLKIDRSFIQDIFTDDNDKAIIIAIVAMAHQLQLRTVAEGVETPEQLAFLRDNGCDLSQGYLHSRPCSATALRDLLRAAPRDQT